MDYSKYELTKEKEIIENFISVTDTIRDVKDNENSKLTPMQNCFRGKTVFLTGGTGALGTLFTEKLLRCEVKCIYLLARPKKGVRPEDRIKEIFTGKLFSKLYAQDKHYFKRIRIIEGDLMQLQLAISESDMNDIIENVEMVIHAGAEVRFDETLRKLIMCNLRGTRELLNIAEKIKKLQVFSYISTAYSNCYRTNIDEKFYPPPVDPNIMIKFVENYFDKADDSLEIMQDIIIRPWPNTYTYTKSLSEALVRQYGPKLPICIIRPTVVISTHEDPLPGWCNNIYGLNGVLVACGMGILRLMPLNRKIKGDIICADFVINSTLAAMWVTYEDCKFNQLVNKDPEIYHVSSCQDRPMLWGEIADETRKIFTQSPAKRMLWKHLPNSTTCPFWWKILPIYYHVIPGYFFDFVLKLKGKKVRLMPVYRKVQKFMVALKYFMSTEFIFTNSNMKRVLARMSKDDQEYFPSDVRRFQWKEFVYDYVCGLKVYIGYESMEHVDNARGHYRKLCVMHAFVLIFYYGIHLFFLYQILKFYNVIDYWKRTITDTYEFIQNP